MPTRLRTDPDWLNQPPLLDLPGVSNADPFLQGLPAVAPDNLDGVRGPEKDRRLGREFENRVAAAVQASPGLELVARNLQIFDNHRTLGELDMLVRDKARDVLMHWEITVKFYLGLTPDHWPGPNPADSLGQRAKRLLEHQFPMLHNTVCQQLLQSRGWSVQEQYLFSRGRLFYPAGQHWPAPKHSHAPHLHGQWWTEQQLTRQPHHWQPLEKSEWLQPPSMSDNQHNWLASNQMIDYVEAAGRPVMALRHVPAATAQPDFIVPQRWLDDARSAQSFAQPAT